MNTIYKYTAFPPSWAKQSKYSELNKTKQICGIPSHSTSGKNSPLFPVYTVDGFFIVIQEFIFDKQAKSF